MFYKQYILITALSLTVISCESNRRRGLKEVSSKETCYVVPEVNKRNPDQITMVCCEKKVQCERGPKPAEINVGCWQGDYKCENRVFKESCSLSAEWLYFKAIEDSLKYAQNTPQNATLTPKSASINQRFDYTSGFRLGLAYRLPGNNWEIGGNWMQYESDNPKTHHDRKDFGILAVLALPTYGIPQNSQTNDVKGKWSLEINSLELNIQLPLQFTKRFILTPFGGVKAGFVSQKIDVEYGNFLIFQPTANTPQRVTGKNDMWGVGPMIGMSARFLFPCQFSLFFTGNVAGLCGQFSLDTTYKEFSGVPKKARLTVGGSQRRVSVVEQIQTGIEKKWQVGRKLKKKMEIEVAVGWEVQIWSRQMRLNLFDTFVEPSDGADLTLYGPFVKAVARF